MKRYKSILIVPLLVPFTVSAQLSSTNYQVVGPGFGGAGFTSNATSTNYDLDVEPGGQYEYDDTVDSGSGGTSDPDPTPDPEPTPDPTPDPEPTPDPTPDPEPTPDPTPDPEPTPDPTPDPVNSDDDNGSVVSEENDDDAGSKSSGKPNNNSDTLQSETDDTTANTAETSEKKSGIVSFAQDSISTVRSSVGKVTGNLSRRVSQLSEQYKEPLQEVAEVVEPAKRPIQTAGTATGVTLTMFGLARAPLSLSHVGKSLAQLFYNVFGLLGLWKRRRPWGTVYDSVTKAPLDPAQVVLLDKNGEPVQQAITDLDGRYGFVNPGEMYSLRVQKTNYRFPSIKRPAGHTDVLYRNLYFGGVITDSDIVAHDIPMDPIDFDWNQYEKLRTQQTTFFHRFDPLFVRLLDVLFYAGAVVAVWQAIVQPSFLSLSIAVITALIMVLRSISGGPVLYGSVFKGPHPIPFAVIKVSRGGRVIASKVADQFGRYVLLIPNGEYDLEVQEQVSEGEYRTVYKQPVVARKGVINEKVVLKQADEQAP